MLHNLVTICLCTVVVDASTANTAATQQYSAVAFDYGSSGSTTVLPVEEPAPAPAPPIVPDTPFVPQFAVPESIKGHMPSTERMHKVELLVTFVSRR